MGKWRIRIVLVCAVVAAFMCVYPPQLVRVTEYHEEPGVRMMHTWVFTVPTHKGILAKSEMIGVDTWRLATELGIVFFPALAALLVLRKE